MNKTLTATAAAFIGLVSTAGPALAAPAATEANWNSGCTAVIVESTKDISNLVYRVDGVDTKIEFEDGTHEFTLPGEATDVWIKSGDNHSGDGPGYGQHHPRPDNCGLQLITTVSDDSGANTTSSSDPSSDPSGYSF